MSLLIVTSKRPPVGMLVEGVEQERDGLFFSALVLCVVLCVVLGVFFDVVFRHVCREVVEFNCLAVLEIVDGVDPASAAFLDGTFRLVILLLALLPTQPLGRCGWAEVGRTIAPSRTSRAAESTTAAGTEAAATAAKATTASRTRAAEAATAAGAEAAAASEATAARARTAEAPTRPRAAGWTVFARARLTDREVAAHEGLGIEFLDDLFGDRALREFHEGEAAGPPGLSIDRHDDVRGFRDRGKVRAEICLRGPVGEVADEQTDCQ
jgi:hypothetical protein